MKLSDYKELLTKHDWHYKESNDPLRLERGERSLKLVVEYRNFTPKHTETYINYRIPE